MRKINKLFQQKIILIGAISFGFLIFGENSFGQLTASIAEQTDVLCFGGSTGEIVVSASGGTEPYEYKIDDNEYQESNILENLAAGTYDITVKDGGDNTFTWAVVILEPTALTVVITLQTDVECEGHESGALDITASGGTSPYIYSWTSSDGSGVDPEAEDQTELGEGTYVLVVTDNNGCIAVLSATIIHVGEIVPPTMIGGSDGQAQCIGSEPGENPNYLSWRDSHAGITAYDNCGIKSLVYDEGVWITDGCSKSNTVAFLAADNNDNTTTVSFTFSIIDLTPPVITGGDDGSGEDTESEPGSNEHYLAWRNNFAGATAEDLCGSVTLSNNEGNWTSSDEAYTITVDFIATNECGLYSTASFSFTIIKQNTPQITCPADISVECLSDLPPADISEVSAIGNNVTISHVGDISDGNTCPEIISRTYRATDEDDKIAECIQLITIHDNTPPVISCPGPISVGSIEEVPDVDIDLVIATDNCSNSVIITHVSDIYDQNNCSDILTRTFMATDDCGNSTLCTQLITINDINPPFIICPENIMVTCHSDVPPADVSLVTAIDNCGNILITHVEDVSDGNTCPETILRVYNAIDESGNSAECIQTIMVMDTIAPNLFGIPVDITVSCNNIPDPPEVTAADNCTPTEIIIIDFIELANSVENCKGAIVRQWIATDECGNISMDYQTIIVDPVTGIDNNSINEGLLVYPNPSHGEFTLNYVPETTGPVMMQVLDISGRIVFDKTYHTNGNQISELVQLSNSSKGIYYIRLTTDLKVVYGKIIID